jgi:hypothetical protein
MLIFFSWRVSTFLTEYVSDNSLRLNFKILGGGNSEANALWDTSYLVKYFNISCKKKKNYCESHPLKNDMRYRLYYQLFWLKYSNQGKTSGLHLGSPSLEHYAWLYLLLVSTPISCFLPPPPPNFPWTNGALHHPSFKFQTVAFPYFVQCT